MKGNQLICTGPPSLRTQEVQVLPKKLFRVMKRRAELDSGYYRTFMTQSKVKMEEPLFKNQEKKSHAKITSI